MKEFFSRLSSSERRFVVGVGLLFFLVINIFWVWPHFDDWSRTQARLKKAQDTLQNFQTEIAQLPEVERQVKALESEGLNVPAEDQVFQFLDTINKQAAQSGIGFAGNPRQSTSTNQFFLERTHTISVQGGEKQLVDFLYSLGAGNSLIRVRDLSVTPDQQRQQLNALITLVASYQKKLVTRAPAAPAGRSAASPARTTSSPAAPASPAKQPATPTKK